MSTTTSSYLLQWQIHYNNCVIVVDASDDASIDEFYVTYVDCEHVDNNYYNDSTDDDHDSNNGIKTHRACNARFNTCFLFVFVSLFFFMH